jgi:hypothetical protein
MNSLHRLGMLCFILAIAFSVGSYVLFVIIHSTVDLRTEGMVYSVVCMGIGVLFLYLASDDDATD